MPLQNALASIALPPPARRHGERHTRPMYRVAGAEGLVPQAGCVERGTQDLPLRSALLSAPGSVNRVVTRAILL